VSIYIDIQNEILTLCGQGSGGAFQTEVQRTVNRYYRRILGAVDQDNEHREFTLTTVSGQSQYGLPLHTKRILNIADDTAKWALWEMTRVDYDRGLAGTTASGPAESYYQFGVYGSQAKPSTTATITVESSVATDATNRYVRIAGFDGSNNYRTERITLNGTSTVASTISYNLSYPLETVSKDNEDGSSITGDITVKDNAGNTLAVMPVGMDTTQYRWVEMYPTPDDARSLVVRSIMSKVPLVNDMDVPGFDVDYHGLLVSGPVSELCVLSGRPQLAITMRADFDREFAEFKATQQRKPNREMVFREVTRSVGTTDRARIGTLNGVNALMPARR